MKEKIYFGILDEVSYIGDKLVETKPEYLVNFLKIDKDFVEYCEHHTNYDGIVAKLKYENQIEYKKEVIRDALDLAKKDYNLWE